MAEEKRAPGEDPQEADEDAAEAERAREEELEDETRVDADEAREDAAGDQENVDNHRDEEPFES
ncbi:hypothetical protein G9466_18445 [Halorussus sp. JP-T4]|nr:hypothetical protein [Halorussus sp. JP-T4]NHN61047.1 hypothetical protein [Halorussus sp. JP-T4]